MHYEIVNDSRKLVITPELESALEKQLRRLDPLVASFPEDPFCCGAASSSKLPFTATR